MKTFFLIGLFFLYVLVSHYVMGLYRKQQKTNDKIFGLIITLSLGLGLALGLSFYFSSGIDAAIGMGLGIGLGILFSLIVTIGTKAHIYGIYKRDIPAQDSMLHLNIVIGILAGGILLTLQLKLWWIVPLCILLAILGYIVGYKKIILSRGHSAGLPGFFIIEKIEIFPIVNGIKSPLSKIYITKSRRIRQQLL